jgi:hypothetical protein
VLSRFIPGQWDVRARDLADFPDLTADDIKACLAFAADRERRLVTVPAAGDRLLCAAGWSLVGPLARGATLPERE